MQGVLSPVARGDGWVHARIGRRVYRRRLWFARYDVTLEAEGQLLELDSGWCWVGRENRPLVEIIDEGWIPRPRALPTPGFDGGAEQTSAARRARPDSSGTA